MFSRRAISVVCQPCTQQRERTGSRGGTDNPLVLSSVTRISTRNHPLTYLTIHKTCCCVHSLCTVPRKKLRTCSDANFRSGFLLKLSTASATSSDAVKLCLVLLQTELLGFSAVHTAAHADVTATWCCSLVNTALSIESDAAWRRASRALAGIVIFLLAEFRGEKTNRESTTRKERTLRQGAGGFVLVFWP